VRTPGLRCSGCRGAPISRCWVKLEIFGQTKLGDESSVLRSPPYERAGAARVRSPSLDHTRSPLVGSSLKASGSGTSPPSFGLGSCGRRPASAVRHR